MKIREPNSIPTTPKPYLFSVLTFLLLLISGKENEIGTKEKVNKTNFERLEKGMTLPEVKGKKLSRLDESGS